MAGIEQNKPARLRQFAAVLGAALLSGCASDPPAPPAQSGDICAIFAERPEWRDATLRAAGRWGAPVELQMAIIWKESSFRGDVRPPDEHLLWVIPTGPASSAYGYPQAIDGTWEWYIRETGNTGAEREDFADAVDFVGWYVNKTRETAGVDVFDAYSHYLAYHEGHAGFRRASYSRKAWLQNAARQVAARAARYRGQLRRC